MALIIKILISLFKRNYRLVQLYTKMQGIKYPKTLRYLKA
jgi:hypothetical protein